MTWALSGYEPLAELGSGSMGRVVQARQLSSDRLVAVKQLHLSTSRAARSRLAREARALSLLDNPHVVRFLELESVGDDLYLILELVEGAPLSTVFATETLSVGDALAVISQLASGMQYIHERGVIHRDVKPSNVLLSSDGLCKLNDFGLVRLLDVASGNPLPMTVLTKEGMPVGTAAYMSPEAVVGDKNLDQRADLYALAVMSYRLLLGRPPFADSLDLLSMLTAQLDTPPPDPKSIDPSFPDPVAAPIMRALHKDRNDRQDTVEEFWRELESAAAVAWAGWSGTSDLRALVAAHDHRRWGPGSMGATLDAPTLPPVDAVSLTMPKLKRYRRRRALVLSAAIGAGLAVGGFEILRYATH